MRNNATFQEYSCVRFLEFRCLSLLYSLTQTTMSKRTIDAMMYGDYLVEKFPEVYASNRIVVFFKLRYDYTDEGRFSNWDGVIDYFQDIIEQDHVPICGIYADENLGKMNEQVKRHCHFNFFTTVFETTVAATNWVERVKQRITRDKDSGFKHSKCCFSFVACTGKDQVRSEDNLLQYPLKHVEHLGEHIYMEPLFREQLPDFNLQLRWESARAFAIDNANRRLKAVEKMAQRSTYEVLLDQLDAMKPSEKPHDEYKVFLFIIDYLKKEKMPIDDRKVKSWVMSLSFHLKLIDERSLYSKIMM